MMFINTIFLPKNMPDQTLPESVTGKTGGFSHLFSNVFRIVSDGQETANPLPLLTLNQESIENSQNELLKISLLSNKKLPLDISNISKIVETFLKKINQDEPVTQSQSNITVKNDAKISKLFSLSKNDFVKEIKQIIDTIKSDSSSNLEKVNIILVSNGQSINLNPATTNVVELEGWVAQQLQSNSDFEILVKRGKSKLSVDVEPVKNETLTKTSPLIVVAENLNETKSHELQIDIKTPISGTGKVADENDKPLNIQAPLQPQLQGAKQVSVSQLNNQTTINSVQISANTKNQIAVDDAGIIKQVNKPVVTEATVKTEQRLTQNELNSLISNSNNAATSKIPADQINVNGDEQKPELNNRSLESNTARQIKIETDATPITVVKETAKDEKKINVKSNKKINAFTTNNSTTQIKQSIVDLFEKTNVKSVDVNIKSFTKKVAGDSINPQVKHLEVKDVKQPNNVLSKNDVVENKIVDHAILKENRPVLASGEQQKIKVNLQDSTKVNYLKDQKITGDLGNKILNDPEQNRPTVNTAQQKLFNENDTIENKSENTPLKEVLKNSNTIKVKNDPELKEKTSANKTYVPNSEYKNDNKSEVVTDRKTESKPVLNHIKEVNHNLSSNKNAAQTLHQTEKSNELKPEITTETIINNKTEIKTAVHESVKSKEFETTNSLSNQTKLNTEKSSEPRPEFKSETVINSKSSFNQEIIESGKTKDFTATDINRDKIKPLTDKPSELKPELKTESVLNNNADYKQQVSESDKKNNFKVIENPNHQNKQNTESIKKQNSESEYVKPEIKLNADTKVQLKNTEELKQVLTNKSVNTEQPKSVNVDFNQRRVFSNIPPLEVLENKPEINDLSVANKEEIKVKEENTALKNDTVKTAPNTIEPKAKTEKQIWVRVSFDNSDEDFTADTNKTPSHNHKITVDLNSDRKNEFTSNENTGSNSKENQKQNTHSTVTESANNSDLKNAGTTQSTVNHNEMTSGIKQEHKTEVHQFKTDLSNENTKLSSRASEMIERVKVISSGEMIREVYKVFESGEKQSIVLKLVPRDLGSVKIIIDSVDNLVNARVEVENESVGHLLRNTVEQLKQNLAHNGVNVNSISISYQGSEQKQHGFNNQKRKNLHYEHGNELPEEDETVVIKKLGYNTYEYLA